MNEPTQKELAALEIELAIAQDEAKRRQAVEDGKRRRTALYAPLDPVFRAENMQPLQDTANL
jgi:hypothetical protein